MSRAAGTLGPAVAEFMEGCLRIPDGPHQGEPFRLEPFQRAATDIIYETDERGLPMWKLAIFGVGRGAGKSPLCAGYASHALITGVGSPQCFCAAAARTQAGLVHTYATKEAQGGPLDDYLEFPRIKEALGPIKCPDNGGILRVLSADGDLQQGLVPYFVAVDELHVFTTRKQTSLFDALHTAMHKREDSRMLVITTAGSTRESLLGQLIDAITEQGEVEYHHDGCLTVVRDYAAKRLLIWYGAPEDADIRDPRVWRACNPASWITDESLRVAAGSTPESEFRRYYLNQWVKGEDAAIQPAAWDACRQDGIEMPPPGADLWLGVDNGGQRDTGAITWLCPREDGRLQTGAFIYMAPEGRATAAPLIEAKLRELRETYNLRAIGYDRYQMDDMAARLSSEGFPMILFGQKNDNMVPASQLTFDLINDRVLVHDGARDFRAHVLGTGAELTSTGGWRFVKAKTKTGARDKSKNNDACIALAMAVGVWRADTSQVPTECGVFTVSL